VTILSAADLSNFGREGFVVIPEAVTPAKLTEVIGAIKTVAGVSVDDPSTWYAHDTFALGGFVPVWGPLSTTHKILRPAAAQSVALWTSAESTVAVPFDAVCSSRCREMIPPRRQV
jgi:hypothetical protein